MSETARTEGSGRWREGALWTVAVVAAIAAGIAMRAYLRDRAEEARVAVEARYAPAPVVVARRDLPPGTVLEGDALAVRRMPANFLPASTVRDEDAGALFGRTLEHAVRAGEPIQMPLLRAREDMHLATRVPLGRRAVTIAVDETASLAGMIRPGDRIDLTFESGGSRQSLANVAVLATGRRMAGHEDGGYATLTLELDAPAARRLMLAHGGSIAVGLRNPADTGVLPEGLRGREGPRAMPVALIIGGQGGPIPAVRLLGVAP